MKTISERRRSFPNHRPKLEVAEGVETEETGLVPLFSVSSSSVVFITNISFCISLGICVKSNC